MGEDSQASESYDFQTYPKGSNKQGGESGSKNFRSNMCKLWLIWKQILALQILDSDINWYDNSGKETWICFGQHVERFEKH